MKIYYVALLIFFSFGTFTSITFGADHLGFKDDSGGGSLVDVQNVNFDKLFDSIGININPNIEILTFGIYNCSTPVNSNCQNVQGNCTTAAQTTCSTTKTTGGGSTGGKLNVAPAVTMSLDPVLQKLNSVKVNLDVAKATGDLEFPLYITDKNNYSQVVRWTRNGIDYAAAFIIYNKEMMSGAQYASLPLAIKRDLNTLFMRYDSVMKIYLLNPMNANQTNMQFASMRLYSEVGELTSTESLPDFSHSLTTNVKRLWVDTDNNLNITYLNVPDARKRNAVHPELTVTYELSPE